MKLTREWAMPNADTFDVPVIGAFVKRHLRGSTVSADPFARNKRWATHTNDLNAETAADSHMDARDFLAKLRMGGVRPDLVILDPPYSFGQIVERYQGVVGKMSRLLRDEVRALLAPGGTVLTFGWNSVGMGQGFEITEIMLVCHGSDHNDTICMAERQIQPVLNL